MTPKQYKKMRTDLGLNLLRLADELDVSDRQIRRREKGESPILREAEFAIKYLTDKWKKNEKL